MPPEPGREWSARQGSADGDGTSPTRLGHSGRISISWSDDPASQRRSAGDGGVGPDPRKAAELRPLLRESMRVALLTDPYRSPHEEKLREPLGRACEIARRQATRVEQLLILLKEVCREMPEARVRRDTDAQDTLAHVITLCIKEYYGPRNPA